MPKVYWVSDCCLSPTHVFSQPTSHWRDSPPDPIVVCTKCERPCEEWGLTREEYINELRKAGKDPEDFGFEGEPSKPTEPTSVHQEE